MDREGTDRGEENLSAMTSAKEPKQDKETLRARWAWVEHRVWTDSMLRSLEKRDQRRKMARITNGAHPLL
jgi:hypothetical protein